MIRREVDASDRRQKRIYLTERGQRLWEYTRQNADRTLASATKNIQPEELTLCIDVLQRVYANLHQQLSIPQNNHQ
jgi:DNA-binding MarR family transcriptional regulator